jgi:group I intron endonuclease
MNQVPMMFYNILANKALILATLAKTAGVYLILNNITGQIYIGSAVDLAKRLGSHFRGQKSNIRLQNAFRKYGLLNFSLIILDICAPNKELLLALEQLAFNLYKPAYNLLQIAGNSLGLTHTEESKQKMSDAKTGAKHPMFGKKGALNPMFGSKPTIETRKQISDSLKGRAISEETRKRLSAAQKRVDRSGANHPGFGKVPSSAHTVYVYSLDHLLIQQFPSKVAAAKWLNVSAFTVNHYIKNNKVFQGRFILTASPNS